MHLRDALSGAFNHVQTFLFPFLRQEIGPLTQQHERLIVVLGMAGIERFVKTLEGYPGRPCEDRRALARAFVTKARRCAGFVDGKARAACRAIMRLVT